MTCIWMASQPEAPSTGRPAPSGTRSTSDPGAQPHTIAPSIPGSS